MIMKSNFEIAFDLLIKHEGYYSNDPNDKGGETKYGISKKSYPDIDINNLTLEQAKSIYKNDYWDNMQLDDIAKHSDNSAKLAIKVFDIGVNVGCKNAIKFLQRAIRSVTSNNIKIDDDGILGIITKNTIIEFNPFQYTELLVALRSETAGYYRSLNNENYIKGWLNRAYS